MTVYLLRRSASGRCAIADQTAFQTATAALGFGPNPNFVPSTLQANTTNGIQLLAPNYVSPRSVQMNAGVQRQLHPGTVLSVDFVRSVGTHTLLERNTVSRRCALLEHRQRHRRHHRHQRVFRLPGWSGRYLLRHRQGCSDHRLRGERTGLRSGLQRRRALPHMRLSGNQPQRRPERSVSHWPFYL